MNRDQIRRAVELGLGVKSADLIQIITGDKESEALAVEIRKILAKG